MALDENNEVIGYEFIRLGQMLAAINGGMDANEAVKKFTGTYGRFADGVKFVNPRKEQEVEI